MIDLPPSCKVWTPSGDCIKGVVHYSTGIPEISINSRIQIMCDAEGVHYEETKAIIPNDQGIRKEISLSSPVRIRFTPLLVRNRPYTEHTTETENIYPKSTYSWYGRTVYGSTDATFIVQEIIDDKKLWLIIIDPATSKVFEKHFIQPYEFWTLVMDGVEYHKNNWLVELGPENPEPIVQSIVNVLKEEMTWPEIAQFTKGVPAPAFERGRTIRDTLDNLIPIEITGRTRDELILFYAWLIKRKLAIDEPVSYFYNLSSLPYFKALLEIHTRFIVEGLEPPDYLRELFILLHSLPDKEKVLSETLSDKTFTRYLYRLMEHSPDWRNSIIRQISILNESDRVSVKFPVSASRALESENAFKSRFALFTNGLHLRTHARAYAFGLRRVVVLANAHRWIHPMLDWSVHLTNDKSPIQMQVMMMPPTALVRAKRILPNLTEIGYSARSWNPDLFDHEQKKWRVRKIQILSSVRRKKSRLALRNSFGDWQEEAPYQLTMDEARMIDLANVRLNLAYLEKSTGLKHLGSSKERVSEFLTNLREKGGIQVSYEFNETRLPRPIFIIAKGNPKQIRSLTYSMLTNTPSTTAYLAKGNDSTFIVSSVPETTRDILLQELPKVGMEHDMSIRCMMPLTYRNCTSDLFQRLLKKDGSWIDNVSGLITQARSLPLFTEG